MKKFFSIALASVVLLYVAQTANAQDVASDVPQPIPLGISSPATDPAAATNETSPAEAPAASAADAAVSPVPVKEGAINPNDVPSLLFTFWEHTAIVDAKRSRGLVRQPTEEELLGGLKGRESHKIKPPPEEREIALSGIVFVHSDDWTIWLNGKRVTPKAIPKEVMDLKVYKEYVEMKWIDDYTNQIFPLRLRPHQRFNIDSRIFLPG